MSRRSQWRIRGPVTKIAKPDYPHRLCRVLSTIQDSKQTITYKVSRHHWRLRSAISVLIVERRVAGSSDVYRFLALVNESPKRISSHSGYFADCIVLATSSSVPKLVISERTLKRQSHSELQCRLPHSGTGVVSSQILPNRLLPGRLQGIYPSGA